MKGRFIHDNVLILSHLLEFYSNSKNLEGFILFLDFTKAFDKVSLNYLFTVLKHLNFGEKFISAIKTLLIGNETSIQINGYHSNPFKLITGVPQHKEGYPLSPLLFLIAVEPLANAIRNSLTNGIKFKTFEKKISLFL